MRISLNFKSRETNYGYAENILFQVKATDSEGKYKKFAKITPELLQYIKDQSFEVPEDLIK